MSTDHSKVVRNILQSINTMRHRDGDQINNLQRSSDHRTEKFNVKCLLTRQFRMQPNNILYLQPSSTAEDIG